MCDTRVKMVDVDHGMCAVCVTASLEFALIACVSGLYLTTIFLCILILFSFISASLLAHLKVLVIKINHFKWKNVRLVISFFSLIFLLC